MKYGYARVSTYSQKKDGNSLESQRELLLNEGCTEVFSDAYSGLKTDRPEFTKLLGLLKEGDTLVVTKLDRFSRSASAGIKLIDSLLEKGVKVHILNIGLMDTTPTGKLIRNIFFSFAEFERDMIVERTQEGKAIAKQREDFTEGRPQKYSNKQIKHAIDLKQSGMSYKQVTEVTGISKATLIRRMKEYQ
jgi:DNA invertase Pin-like site-specific DNA recombinase